MAVITSSRETILAQDFCNKVSGLSPGKKDRQSIFEFTEGAKKLGVWDSLICWPVRSIHNSTERIISLGGGGEQIAFKSDDEISIQETGAVSFKSESYISSVLTNYKTENINTNGINVFTCLQSHTNASTTYGLIFDCCYSGPMIGNINWAGQNRYGLAFNNISRTWVSSILYNPNIFNNSNFQIHQFNYTPNNAFTHFYNGYSENSITSSFIEPYDYEMQSPIIQGGSVPLSAVFGGSDINATTAVFGIIKDSQSPNLYSLLKNTLCKGLNLPETPPLSALFNHPTTSNYEYYNKSYFNANFIETDSLYTKTFSNNSNYLFGTYKSPPPNSLIVLDIPFTDSNTNPPLDQSVFNRAVTMFQTPVIQNTITRNNKNFAGFAKGRIIDQAGDLFGGVVSDGHWRCTLGSWNSLLESFAIETWVYLPSENLNYFNIIWQDIPNLFKDNAIWGVGGPSAGGPRLIVRNDNFSNPRLGLYDGIGPYEEGQGIISLNEPFALDEWVHTAVKYDKTTFTLKIYVNGVLKIQQQNVLFGIGGDLSNLSFNIGATDPNSVFSGIFRGYLSNFRMYSSVY